MGVSTETVKLKKTTKASNSEREVQKKTEAQPGRHGLTYLGAVPLRVL